MKQLNRNHAVVMFSGGQDSTVCLMHALKKYERVSTVGFDYGQRHRHELSARQLILMMLRSDHAHLAKDLVLDLRFFGKIGSSALTTDHAIAPGDDNLPNTFVPGRNLIFLTIASAYAYQLGAGVVIGGMSQVDYSGYPDCREGAISAQQMAVNHGMETEVVFEMPLLHKRKADIWRMAEQLGGKEFVETVRLFSYTCYENDDRYHHVWGTGCGKCPACVLRKNGYEEYIASTT